MSIASYTFIVDFSIANCTVSIRMCDHDDQFLMCCNSKSNSFYQVHIQDKLIAHYFVITIYRSQHVGVFMVKETSSASILSAASYMVLN